MGGTTAVRFPVDGDPRDDGWHIDGSYEGPDGGYWVNHRSRGRALLMLVLFSDVAPADGPTRLLAGSQLDVPAALAPFGEEGVASLRFEPPACVHDRPLALATGQAGDVHLCHPFLVHAAQRNGGTAPRFVAQPGVPWKDDACGISPPPDPPG
jgi:ectoine hydroxylase-related dioxygenase (phytanoyl-CoA dioxygenase family)